MGMLIATSTPSVTARFETELLISYQTYNPVMESVRSGRVHIFCSDVLVQNQNDLFTKLLDKITKLKGVS